MTEPKKILRRNLKLDPVVTAVMLESVNRRSESETLPILPLTQYRLSETFDGELPTTRDFSIMSFRHKEMIRLIIPYSVSDHKESDGAIGLSQQVLANTMGVSRSYTKLLMQDLKRWGFLIEDKRRLHIWKGPERRAKRYFLDARMQALQLEYLKQEEEALRKLQAAYEAEEIIPVEKEEEPEVIVLQQEKTDKRKVYREYKRPGKKDRLAASVDGVKVEVKKQDKVLTTYTSLTPYGERKVSTSSSLYKYITLTQGENPYWAAEGGRNVNAAAVFEKYARRRGANKDLSFDAYVTKLYQRELQKKFFKQRYFEKKYGVVNNYHHSASSDYDSVEELY